MASYVLALMESLYKQNKYIQFFEQIEKLNKKC